MNYVAISILLILVIAATISAVYGFAYIRTLKISPLIYAVRDAYDVENGYRIIVVTLYGNYVCYAVPQNEVLDFELVERNDVLTAYMIVTNATVEGIALVCNGTYVVRV